MKTIYLTIGFLLISFVGLAQNLLNHPESVVYDSAYQRYLVSNWEDGNIVAIDNTGQQQLFNDTLQHVAGLHINNDVLYACSYQGILAGIVGFDLFTSDIVFYKSKYPECHYQMVLHPTLQDIYMLQPILQIKYLKLILVIQVI